MGKEKLKIEGMISRNQAISRLEELLESLRNGAIQFQFGDESLALTPQDVMDLELKASKKKKEEKISLVLSWQCQELTQEKDIKIGAPDTAQEKDIKISTPDTTQEDSPQ